MDHERVNVSSSHMSCGIMELSRIGDEKDAVLYSLASRLYHPARGAPCAAFLWSDIVMEGTSSELLRDTVIKYKFGDVSRSRPMENPRTGNMICVYTWIIDHTLFKEWYSQQRVKKLAEVGS
jgi:hypothetical protein